MNPKKSFGLATKDIRVAWVWPSLDRSSRWHQLFKEFTKLVPNTVFFTGVWPGFARGFEGTFKVEKLSGVRMFSLGRNELGIDKGFAWVSPSALLRLLRFRPHVILTSGFGLCAFYTLIVKALTGSPVILLWQGVAAETGGEPGTVRLWVRRMMAPFLDLTICNTREGTEYLRTLVGIPAAKLWHYVLEVGGREALCTQESKEDVIPSVERPVFLFVGRLMQTKGVHKLLEASRLLVERGLECFSLVVVGDGDQKQEVCRLARALGIETRVHWAGFVPHEALGRYYQACDVFVLPSLEDTWGVVVPEAMAFGKPVLCSQHAGANEIVRHGVNGFVFDAYKPEELADYMERFIREPGLIEKYGAASDEIISQYAHPRVASALAGVVARVLDSEPPIPLTQSTPTRNLNLLVSKGLSLLANVRVSGPSVGQGMAGAGIPNGNPTTTPQACSQTALNAPPSRAAGRSEQNLSQTDFLRTLFAALDEHGTCYCVLHSWEALPENLSSDLDLVVHPSDMQKLPLVFTALRTKGYKPVQCLNYFVNAHYFVFAWFEGPIPKFAAVDIISEHRRGGLIASTGEELVEGRRRHKMFWIPEPAKEFAYLLVKRAWKATASARQAERLKLLVSEMGQPRAKSVARELFGNGWAEQIVEACASGHVDGLFRKLRTQLWRTSLVRNPLRLIGYLISDGLRRVRRWLQPAGVLIAIMGPDGVGKSSLVTELAQRSSPTFRRQRVFHWRPSVLRHGAKNGVPTTQPHEQPLRGTLASMARLLGVFLDYWLGYLLVIRPLLARSTLIVSDRYFHDVLVDPRRYRYGGPLWLPRLLSRYVSPPQLLFLVLDAPEEVILSRKREVPVEELRRQRIGYQQLARDFSFATLIKTNEGFTKTPEEAFRVLLAYLGQRFQRRYNRGVA